MPRRERARERRRDREKERERERPSCKLLTQCRGGTQTTCIVLVVVNGCLKCLKLGEMCTSGVDSSQHTYSCHNLVDALEVFHIQKLLNTLPSSRGHQSQYNPSKPHNWGTQAARGLTSPLSPDERERERERERGEGREGKGGREGERER